MSAFSASVIQTQTYKTQYQGPISIKSGNFSYLRPRTTTNIVFGLHGMAQFGGKIPPPWQTRPQSTPIQSSLLGQHPASAGPIPNQQIVIGAAPQGPQYAPVQQSMIQPPGLGGLQTLPQPSLPQPHLAQHNIPQPICSSNVPQPGQPSIAQVSLPQPNICQGNSSLMGQPPLSSQNLATANLVSHSQLVPSQMQQIQPQVTTVAYPTPRALAPPGSFSSQGAPVNLAANMNNNMAGSSIVSSGPPTGAGVGSGGPAQPPQKQRVFTGSITKFCADFGFVDEDVFFQTSCVKGPVPKVGDRVLVEASYNPNMPFKWNANRVQVIPGPVNSSGPSTNRASGPRESSRNVSFNAVPPPNFNNDNQNSPGFSSRSTLGPRPRSPRRDRRDDIKRGSRDRLEREEKDKDIKRESRKRSRSRDRSRSPARRRTRVLPRYNVQVPKIMLHMKEANVLELRKRYSNLYVPSDVFLARPLWSDTFPAHRGFQMPRPVSFHIMNKEVDPVTENNTVYDSPDINHSYAAKVMLMAVPPMEDIYRRSCALSEDPGDVKSCFVHPTRLINFLVGLKGKNETMAIGGYWSPSLDGLNPDKDPNVLIQTAIRTCKALTGIDLSGCTTWYRFAEIYYRRGESTHKGRVVPARVETTVLFLPDVWNICPTKLEWDTLQMNYRLQLERRLQTDGGVQQQSQQSQQQSQQQQQLQQQLEQEDQEEEDGEDKETSKKDPTHWGSLDPKNMKVLELRSELDARVLNSKGLKSQLIARLTKALKVEQEKEEAEKAIAEKMETDESRKKDEEEKRKEEEKKKKEEEDKKKEEEERKKAEERERSLLEKRYTLPEQPMIIVHPSRTAKSGKFDCTTMSLSVLLDYRQEDNKEHSFEVSLFAELFNEMLMRDFAFKIFRALSEAPDKAKEEKKEKEKDKDRERKEEKEEKEEKKEKKEEKEKEDDKEDKSEKKAEKKVEKEEPKEDKELKKEEFEEEEDMEEDFEEDLDEEDSKDGNKTGEKEKEKETKEKEKKKDERRDGRENRREKKKRMVTIDPHLLLSFVYFDQTHTGYIVDKDLEDIINILGMNLSRAQLKKLMSKVLSRDVLYYRKLTDVPVEDRNKQPKDQATVIDLEHLAKGNNYLLPMFSEPSSLPEKVSRKSTRNTPKDEPVITSTGVVKYEGSLVDISKLMQQLARSENARSDTEEKLKDLQKELASTKEDSKRSTEKTLKLSKEVKTYQTNLKTTDEELKKVLEDNSVYQKALNQIKGVIRPLVAGVDIDEDEAVKDDIKPKIEGSKNGFPG